jgi:hypothetical protein
MILTETLSGVLAGEWIPAASRDDALLYSGTAFLIGATACTAFKSYTPMSLIVWFKSNVRFAI